MSIIKLFLVTMSVGAILAAPQLNPKDITVVQQENDFNGIDPWHWSYQTSDGTYQEQYGGEADGSSMRGRYSWTPGDGSGNTYTVTYTADANGYVAKVEVGAQPGRGSGSFLLPEPPRTLGGSPAARTVLAQPYLGTSSQLSLLG